MSNIRDIIEKLSAISEDRPAKGDGFFLEFADHIEIETEIAEITESGDLILVADDKTMMVIESLNSLMEAANPAQQAAIAIAKKKAGKDDNVNEEEDELDEAEYHGRKVPLNKPMKGDVKKSKVYVKDPKTGNIKKVNFGDKNMRIKKSIPGRRKSFRARHNCDNPGSKLKARYWSCRAW